jgi:wyosine [tRNA(Phe)-imidazoG37] synthetase (radical SAM superfamily)
LLKKLEAHKLLPVSFFIHEFEVSMVVFGPVPSRRLGNSLGVNNIPIKVCSYNCVYCQVGRTVDLTTKRQPFFSTAEVMSLVADRVEKSHRNEVPIDYISIVPDGEPTLDIHLGETIQALKTLGFPVAVFTNGSQLPDTQVRRELCEADLISVKIDAVDELAWRKVNRPDKDLRLAEILEGIRSLRQEYSTGKLITETMLISGLNDDTQTVEETARFIATVQPERAYLGIPTRPTAVEKATVPDEETLNRAYQTFSAHLPNVECLFGFSPDDFPALGSDALQQVLEILTVHPMRESEVSAFLKKSGEDPLIIQKLEDEGLVVKVRHGEHSFFTLKIPTRPLG